MGNFNVLVFFTRKPGVSIDDFREHFENHMLHMKKTAGEGFPTKHTRFYLTRTPADTAHVVYGEQSDFPFDGFVVMEFQSKEHKDLFLEKTHTSQELSGFEDDPLLPDRMKRKVARISHICVTEAD